MDRWLEILRQFLTNVYQNCTTNRERIQVRLAGEEPGADGGIFYNFILEIPEELVKQVQAVAALRPLG